MIFNVDNEIWLHCFFHVLIILFYAFVVTQGCQVGVQNFEGEDEGIQQKRG